MAEETKKEKKGFIGKLKESVDDREEQLAVLSTFVRLGILVWSGGILTLAYIKLPPAFGSLHPPYFSIVNLACLSILFGDR